MATYDLPNITLSCGVLKVHIETTATLSPAAGPTKDTILNIGDIVRRLDFTPGTIDFEQMEFTVADDYTLHANGFWYEVLQGTCSVRFSLASPTVDTYLFWGMVYDPETEYTEVYVNGSVIRRVEKIKLLSMLAKLKDLSIANLIAEADSHLIDGSDELGEYIKIKDLITAAVSRGLNGIDWHTEDVSVLAGGGNDFTYTDTGLDDHAFADLYCKFRFRAVTIPTTWYLTPYFDSTHADYWGDKFNNAFEVVQALCLQFGFVPQYSYNFVTSRHNITLVQRGRAASGNSALGTLKSSTFKNDSPLTVGTARVIKRTADTQAWYLYDGMYTNDPPSDWYTQNPKVFPSGSFDFDAECEFVCDEAGVDPNEMMFFIDTTDGNSEDTITKVTYWQYDNATGEALAAPTDIPVMQRALVEYMGHRYYGDGQQTYYRTYEGMYGSVVVDEYFLGGLVDIGGVSFSMIEVNRNLMDNTVALTLSNV